MKRAFFNKQFAGLVAAYSMAQKLPEETQDVYWEMLKDMDEEDFAEAVKECLGDCKFFPTIAELGEAAFPAKQELGAGQIWTKNGWDYPMVKVTWQTQLARIKRKEELKAIKSDPLRPLIESLANAKAVK